MSLHSTDTACALFKSGIAAVDLWYGGLSVAWPAQSGCARIRRDAGHGFRSLGRPDGHSSQRRTPPRITPAPTHEAALTALREAFSALDGLALLDGKPGTGKTLVSLRFLETLDPAIVRVVLPAPRFTARGPAPGRALRPRRRLPRPPRAGTAARRHRSTLGALAAGGPTVVVIDEAHLTADVLEELRLGNLETRAAKAVFVVLVALPALRDRLLRIDAAALAQPHRRPGPGSSRSMPPSP